MNIEELKSRYTNAVATLQHLQEQLKQLQASAVELNNQQNQVIGSINTIAELLGPEEAKKALEELTQQPTNQS